MHPFDACSKCVTSNIANSTGQLLHQVSCHHFYRNLLSLLKMVMNLKWQLVISIFKCTCAGDLGCDIFTNSYTNSQNGLFGECCRLMLPRAMSTRGFSRGGFSLGGFSVGSSSVLGFPVGCFSVHVFSRGGISGVASFKERRDRYRRLDSGSRKNNTDEVGSKALFIVTSWCKINTLCTSLLSVWVSDHSCSWL